jgi:hypothetical protein
MGVDDSLLQTMGLLGGVAMFVGWVLSDLLEEQMIGTNRRERQRAAKRAERIARKTAQVGAARPLPRAVARSRSAVAPRSAP